MTTSTEPGRLISERWAELFQTERSAERHCAVEAERLGDEPPALPMGLVSAHATNALARLEQLAKARGAEVAEAGKGVGELFSQVREKAADLVISMDLSYRGTLIGVRHGVDLMTLVYHASESDEELHAWAGEWLEERRALVLAIEKELAWFAHHPDVALKPVSESGIAKLAKKLT